jgi:hypothetical protein
LLLLQTHPERPHRRFPQRLRQTALLWLHLLLVLRGWLLRLLLLLPAHAARPHRGFPQRLRQTALL